MPSASIACSFPVPLGRRGTAAFAVAGFHVLLLAGLVAGFAARVPPIVVPASLRGFVAPAPPPDVAPPKLDPRLVHLSLPPPDSAIDLPVVEASPVAVAARSAPPNVGDGPTTAPASVEGPARVLASTEPMYPAAARRLGEQGVVLVRALVTRPGRAERVEIAASSGSPRLDAAALEAVRRWTFAPASGAGGPIASAVVLRVVFRLTD